MRNPQTRQQNTLEKLPAWPNSRIDELLPFAPKDIEALLKVTLPCKNVFLN
jgi:hypothetical protein